MRPPTVCTREEKPSLQTFDPTRHAPSDFLDAWFELVQELDDESQTQMGRYYAGYLKRFDPYMRRAYDRRLEPVLNHACLARRVLEVGSGCGSESLLLATLGCDVTGLELHWKRLCTARRRLSMLETMRGTSVTCRFLEGSLFDEDLDLGADRFDLVWMEDTFHHLEPRNQVGARIADLLRLAGTL